MENKIKNHKSVLHEGRTRGGQAVSIQYYDEDDTFRVICKESQEHLFRTPDLNALIHYKRTNMLR